MVVDLVLETVDSLRTSGLSVLLVEQMALSTVRLADRSYVFRTGSVVLEGTRAEHLPAGLAPIPFSSAFLFVALAGLV